MLRESSVLWTPQGRQPALAPRPPHPRCHARDLRADIQEAAATGAPLKTLPSAVPPPKTAGGQCRELVLTKLVGRQKEGYGAAPQVMSDE